MSDLPPAHHLGPDGKPTTPSGWLRRTEATVPPVVARAVNVIGG
ncbi:hypothetical protein AB0M46_21995 [Dactylosporangium sp. NPDC051485]